MEKLFLLDAYALIYRAYYAFIKNPRINSKGFNTSAILGFVNTLEEVLRKENPTHIGIAFDPSGPTFRHEAYEAYKAQREETPEAIRQSVPIIKDIIRAYHIPILEIAGYEADDVIGTLATEAGKRGINTYMMTPDKDYGQLVGEHVFMYRPKYGDKDFEVMGGGRSQGQVRHPVASAGHRHARTHGRYSRQHSGVPGCGRENGTETDSPVRQYREPAGSHRRAERSHQEEGGRKQRANHILKISGYHQNGCAHRTRHGSTEKRRAR